MKKYEIRYDREGNAHDPVQLSKSLLMTGHIDPERISLLFGVSMEDLQELAREIKQQPPEEPAALAKKPKGKPHLRLL